MIKSLNLQKNEFDQINTFENDVSLNPIEETLVELMLGLKTDPTELNIDRVYEAIESTGISQRPPKGSTLGVAELAYVVLCDTLLKKEGFVKGTYLH